MCYSSGSQSGFGLRRKNYGSRRGGPFQISVFFSRFFSGSLQGSPELPFLIRTSRTYRQHPTLAVSHDCSFAASELPAEEGTFADSSRAIRKSDASPCSARAERSVAEGSFEGAPSCYFKKSVTRETASNQSKLLDGRGIATNMRACGERRVI